MKFLTRIVLLLLVFKSLSLVAQVGIGTISPNASAMLEIESSDSGILIPRMSQSQRDAITVNATTTGLLIYQTDNTPGFYYYNGTAWVTFGGAADNDWTVVGNDMFNANTGNVGVGTTSPSAKFHIEDTSGGGTINFTDSFDDGTIAPFTGGIDTDWIITSVAGEFNSGPSGIKSGTISDNASSSFEYNVTVAAGASVSFNYKTDTEACCDELHFYIDGVDQTGAGLINTSFTSVNYALTLGTHVLRWSYEKDVNTLGGADKVYVDDISITNVVVSNSVIRIVDGTEATGKVLTSDANGNASWQTPTGGGIPDNDWTVVGNDMYNANSGNVGVGTVSPTHGLHVEHNEDDAGVMKIQNDTAGGFTGIYFFQSTDYKGHIGYVNTGGTSSFAEKGTFQIASGNRDFIISTNDTGTEDFHESIRVTQDKKLRISDNSGDVTPDYWETYVDNADDYSFAFNGALEAYILDGSGAFQITSDRRLKKNISPIRANVMENILALNPVNYQYKKDKNNLLQNGFIAQEVQQLFPELVDEKNGYLSLNYDAFGVLSIKAIQEQQKTIALQEEKISHLESELSLIKEMLLKLKK